MFPVLASTLQIRRQTREEYQALGLFGPEHCVGSRHDQDYEGKVLVMSPDTLKESCWCAENQLWYAYGGFGSSPTASGLAVYAVGLADGEDVRWNRTGFTDVLDEQFLPDWAQEKLLAAVATYTAIFGSEKVTAAAAPFCRLLPLRRSEANVLPHLVRSHFQIAGLISSDF